MIFTRHLLHLCNNSAICQMQKDTDFFFPMKKSKMKKSKIKIQKIMEINIVYLMKIINKVSYLTLESVVC